MMQIYFDNSATTKPSAAAVAAVNEALCTDFANPSSLHAAGSVVAAKLHDARFAILDSLGASGAKEENLIFTASGTEADNLAILGVAYAKKSNRGKRIIISDSEHPAILEPAKKLEEAGFQVVRIATKNGCFDMEQFCSEMTPDTILVSVMLVNNETGSVNNIKRIAQVARRVNPDVVIHTDAVQGFLKVPCSPSVLDADLITVSSHKIHGPKGVGALYVSPAVLKARRLSPVVFGGGQERGFRSGTENVPGILGFAAAAKEGYASMARSVDTMRAVRSHIIDTICSDPALSEVTVNLPQSETVAPHIVNLRLPYIKSNTMLNFMSAKGICISSGSACAANSGKVSETLLHFGLTHDEADASVRVSLCPDNTIAEAEMFLDALREGVSSLVRFRK